MHRDSSLYELPIGYLFNRLQWCEEYLAGHQDREPGREIYSQDEQKSMSSFTWLRRLKLQYSARSKAQDKG